MKKNIILAALLLTASLAFADVHRCTVGSGTYINWAGQEVPCYGIDFDNDGIMDVAIKAGWDYLGNEVQNGYVEYNYDKVQIMALSAEHWDCFKFYNEGDVIPSANDNIMGEGDGMFYDLAEVSTTASYVAFYFIGADAGYYAYAKIHRVGATIMWDEVYINSTIGAPITVGQGETLAIDPVRPETAAPACTKIFKDGRIYIQRDGHTYDLSGRRID